MGKIHLRNLGENRSNNKAVNQQTERSVIISKIIAFKSSDGQTFDTLEKVQQHEIEVLLTTAETKDNANVNREWAAHVIVTHAEQVGDILSTKLSSRPAARKANGAVRKKRTPKGGLIIAGDEIESTSR